MSNTLISPTDLLEFGTFSDAFLDAAVAEIRAEAGWHIAPRVTETITVRVPRNPTWRRLAGGEIVLPTREFPDGPVVVSSIRSRGVDLAGWTAAGEVIVHWWGWHLHSGVIAVTLEHGLPACPPDLVPVIAARARTAKSPRDPRVTAFVNGGVRMTYGAAYDIDPKVDRYRVLGGVA